MQQTREEINNKALITFLFIAGLTITSLVSWFVYQQQLSRYHQDIENDAQSGFQVVAQNLGILDASIDALAGLYQASNDMDPALFTPFSEKLLEEYSFFKSIHYLTYLSDEEKQEFVEDMRSAGFSQYQIQDFSQQVIADNSQPNYLVSSFIEPLTPITAGLMGSEWLSSGVIYSEIELSVRTNRAVMAHAPEVLNSLGHFLLLRPTYFGRSILDDEEQRKQQLSGFFIIQFDSQLLTHTAGSEHAGYKQLQYSFQLDDIDNSSVRSNDHFFKQNQLELGASEFMVSVSSAYSLNQRDFYNIVLSGFISIFLYLIFSWIVLSRYRISQENYSMQVQLFKERERAQVTLQSIGDAVIATDVKQKINFLNPVAEKLLDCRLHNVKGQSINDLVYLTELPSGYEIVDPIEHYLEIGDGQLKQTGIDIALCVNDTLISVDGTASPLMDLDGDLIGSVLVLRDVSLERQLTNDLVHQASHDALTGLVNRSEFENCLKDTLELSRQNNSQHALCYLDLDQFKLVNDTCGHIAGDELLKQISDLLQVQMRGDDLVARLGGDEFGVLIYACDQPKAEEIAERIRQTLNDYHFSWEEKVFDVSASIGLVMINRLSGNLTEILSCADLACYAAKDAGRNVVHIYKSDDEEITRKFDQMQWLPRIKDALMNDEFDLAIQPIVSLKEEQSPSMIYEFLLRWPQADGSFISPGLFIPSAERYDLMRELDRWIIHKAINSIPSLLENYQQQTDLLFTINLSGQSVGDPGLSRYILDMVKASNVDPRLLCFEITETVAIANFSIASDFIRQLRDKGCRFALDDFGSGLSSFGYLKRLPLDFLKIDGLFVRDMLNDPVDLAMVKTINDVARVLKLQTIAEWVEDKQVLDALKETGVDYAQGFYLEKPCMVKDITG